PVLATVGSDRDVAVGVLLVSLVVVAGHDGGVEAITAVHLVATRAAGSDPHLAVVLQSGVDRAAAALDRVVGLRRCQTEVEPLPARVVVTGVAEIRRVRRLAEDAA